MKNSQGTDPVCCPEFLPASWDEKISAWEDKRFIRDSVFTMFYIPFGFGKAMKRLNEKVENAGASMPGWLCLSDHASRWNMDLYLAVDREIPGGLNVLLNGKYYSKVYEGPFSDTGKWTKDFESAAKARGLSFKKTYMWYTTCPKCAKKYGRNPVVIIAEIT